MARPMTASPFDNPEPALATAARLLDAEDLSQAAAILRAAHATFEQTGYDNWNGGTNIYTLWLRVPPEAYASLGSSRDLIQTQIQERLKPIIEQSSEDWFSVRVAPLVTADTSWRAQSGSIARQTRVAIIDVFRIRQIPWAGEMGEVEFLERLFDLRALPSHDPRHKDAAGDIWRHRVANPHDWKDDWVFSDRRFNLLDSPDDMFLRFLCESVHPAVRPSRNEALQLVAEFNAALANDGWHLIEDEPIAGHPRFVATRGVGPHRTALSRARTVADALDAGWMAREIRRMESAIETDPSLAVGTAKELVESCCKTILARLSVEVTKSMDLPDLVRLVAKQLRLLPDDIADHAKGAKLIKVLLSNLTQIPLGLAELRGLYGSGHGRAGNYGGLEVRHARLAVGAAVTFIDFVTATYHQRTKQDQ